MLIPSSCWSYAYVYPAPIPTFILSQCWSYFHVHPMPRLISYSCSSHAYVSCLYIYLILMLIPYNPRLCWSCPDVHPMILIACSYLSYSHFHIHLRPMLIALLCLSYSHVHIIPVCAYVHSIVRFTSALCFPTFIRSSCLCYPCLSHPYIHLILC